MVSNKLFLVLLLVVLVAKSESKAPFLEYYLTPDDLQHALDAAQKQASTNELPVLAEAAGVLAASGLKASSDFTSKACSAAQSAVKTSADLKSLSSAVLIIERLGCTGGVSAAAASALSRIKAVFSDSTSDLSQLYF